ncbi:CPBP family intramembrane glutamic endopeptidase [Streptosporangium sp. NPDC023825]|uniref:CPBP family intramembrane glutamic endopeptidase n=1 Tax=Streptosporangium sp. NPDC023825 TaxID=3154909 RepID=UPI00343723DF
MVALPAELGIGAAAGVIAFVLKGVVNYAVITLTGFDANPQGPYHDAAGGGVLPLILTFAFLSVLTPVGEEFLFRGVVTNALLRYGPVVGVLSSSTIFALFHGVNIAMTTAFVVGIIAAEAMRRSGSIWPAVAVHTVHNMGLPLFALITGTTGPG